VGVKGLTPQLLVNLGPSRVYSALTCLRVGLFRHQQTSLMALCSVCLVTRQLHLRGGYTVVHIDTYLAMTLALVLISRYSRFPPVQTFQLLYRCQLTLMLVQFKIVLEETVSYTSLSLQLVLNNLPFHLVFSALCTLVQSAVLPSHVVCLSVCPSVRLSVCDVGEL